MLPAVILLLATPLVTTAQTQPPQCPNIYLVGPEGALLESSPDGFTASAELNFPTFGEVGSGGAYIYFSASAGGPRVILPPGATLHVTGEIRLSATSGPSVRAQADGYCSVEVNGNEIPGGIGGELKPPLGSSARTVIPISLSVSPADLPDQSPGRLGLYRCGVHVGRYYGPGLAQAFASIKLQGRISGFCNEPEKLIDPVPSLMNGAAITTRMERLVKGGRPVDGVAADGVSQLLIRVAAEPRSTVTATLQTCTGEPSPSTCSDVNSVREYGGLFDPRHPPPASTLFSTDPNALATRLPLRSEDIDAPSTGAAPMAVFAYRAPVTFADPSAAESEVFVRLAIGDTVVGYRRIKHVRPLVIPVWNELKALSYPPGSTVWQQRYLDAPNLEDAASNMLRETDRMLNAFKTQMQVAAAQVDFVVASRVGIVARAMTLKPLYLESQTYGRGYIHKLITVGTPHTGTPGASFLLQQAGLLCKYALDDGWQQDLAPGPGFLISRLGDKGVPVYAIAAQLNADQTRKWDAFLHWLNVFLACRTPAGGSNQILGGPHDGIVPVASAWPNGVGGALMIGRAHSGDIGEPDMYGLTEDGVNVDNGVLSGLVRSALIRSVDDFGKL